MKKMSLGIKAFTLSIAVIDVHMKTKIKLCYQAVLTVKP